MLILSNLHYSTESGCAVVQAYSDSKLQVIFRPVVFIEHFTSFEALRHLIYPCLSLQIQYSIEVAVVWIRDGRANGFLRIHLRCTINYINRIVYTKYNLDREIFMIGSGSKDLLRTLRSVFPILYPHSHKGQNGRIAVIGGSFEFTGAPYYSAISSLKVGGDLAHIFCSKSSSPSIKSYSPQIIVHPLFISEEQIKLNEQQIKVMHEDWMFKIKAWQKAIHSWIIGPGLGRDRYMNSFFPLLIKNLPQGCVVVIDADGLYYLDQHPHLFDQLKRFRTILTPNQRELTFLQKHFKLDIPEILKLRKQDIEFYPIQNKYTDGSITLLIKGQFDIVLGAKHSFIIGTQGGMKRCGGMGDILAGVTAVSSYWNYDYGAVLASKLVRDATRIGYEKEGRGLTAPYVIKQLSKVVVQFENEKE